MAAHARQPECLALLNGRYLVKRAALFSVFLVGVVACSGFGQRVHAQGRSTTASQAASADEAVWKAFEEFGQGQDGPEVVTAYRKKLLADGLTEQQAWDRIFRIDEIR